MCAASVTASAGNGKATVNWSAPSSNGGSPITSYTVTPYIGSEARPATTVTGSPPATSATITGLTNGTSYTFTVTATNSVGTGPASEHSNTVTPATTPSAPTAVTATAGGASATVSWSAPSNGGSQITSYTITPYIGSEARPTTTITGSPPATSTTITGLTIGTSYTFTVTATNSIGTSAASEHSGAVTPFTTPSAPTALTASAATSQAQVSWTAPSSTGGSPITGYIVTPYIGSSAQTPTELAASSTSTIVKGLTNGTAYTFTVTATNAAGNGPASSASSAVTPRDTIFDFATPATIDSGDTHSTVLGVKFTSTVAGTVTGIRYYKATTNTGTHVGSLWSENGPCSRPPPSPAKPPPDGNRSTSRHPSRSTRTPPTSPPTSRPADTTPTPPPDSPQPIHQHTTLSTRQLHQRQRHLLLQHHQHLPHQHLQSLQLLGRPRLPTVMDSGFD